MDFKDKIFKLTTYLSENVKSHIDKNSNKPLFCKLSVNSSLKM